MNYSKLTKQQKNGILLCTIKLPENGFLNLIQLNKTDKKGINFTIIDSLRLHNCGIYTDYKTAINDFYKKVFEYSKSNMINFQIQFINDHTK